MHYVVDFAPELLEIILESKYLEQAGFSIPELARNVALQVGIFLSIQSLVVLEFMRKTFSLFLFGAAEDFMRTFNPLSTNQTEWSNTLKQFVGKFSTNCLSEFDHFVG